MLAAKRATLETRIFKDARPWWLSLASLSAVLLVFGCGIAAVPERHDAPAEPTSARVAQGARLALLGNCASCHTLPGRPDYAGGVPLKTPFGTIYGTNLTPDAETGLGTWTEAQFRRAMREGVAADGKRLYPAFPFTHFRGLSDDELAALFAYLRTLPATRQAPQPNRLVFPANVRPGLVIWDALYLKNPTPSASRGQHLIDTLGHCGACHTPHNALGAERLESALSGAVLSGWYAPALTRANPSPVRWTRDALVQYLRTGIAEDHAMAAGPMREVIDNLARAPVGDVTAMADTLIQGMDAGADLDRRTAEARARARVPLSDQPVPAPLNSGKQIYVLACAACHDGGRKTGSDSALQLPLAVALYDPEPNSFIQIVRQGIVPGASQSARWMPGFDHTLTSDQMRALTIYLRQAAANEPPWANLDAALKEAPSP